MNAAGRTVAAQIELLIMRRPDLTAPEIADLIGRPRPSTRRTLRAMVLDGALVTTSDRPLRYALAEDREEDDEEEEEKDGPAPFAQSLLRGGSFKSPLASDWDSAYTWIATQWRRSSLSAAGWKPVIVARSPLGTETEVPEASLRGRSAGRAWWERKGGGRVQLEVVGAYQ